MLSWSILQYFRPSLSYHLSLRPLLSLFLSGCLRQVLLPNQQYAELLSIFDCLAIFPSAVFSEELFPVT